MNENANIRKNSPSFINFPAPTRKTLESIFKPIWPDIKFDWIDEKPFKEAFDKLGKIDRDYNLHAVKNDNGDVEKYVIETSYTPFTKDDVKVTLSGECLNVRIGAKNANEKEDTRKKYYIRQISNELFEFNVNLDGLNINKKQISAFCKDGILTINMPVFLPKKKTEENFEIAVN